MLSARGGEGRGKVKRGERGGKREEVREGEEGGRGKREGGGRGKVRRGEGERGKVERGKRQTTSSTVPSHAVVSSPSSHNPPFPTHSTLTNTPTHAVINMMLAFTSKFW